MALGYGGLAAVSRATGMARSTNILGRRELRDGAATDDLVEVRRRGGGRRPHEVVYPELLPALEALVDPVTRGDPESPLRWSCKSTRELATELCHQLDIHVGDKTVARLLRKLGYSLQAPRKNVEGQQHPDRNAQFDHINEQAVAHGGEATVHARPGGGCEVRVRLAP